MRVLKSEGKGSVGLNDGGKWARENGIHGNEQKAVPRDAAGYAALCAGPTSKKYESNLRYVFYLHLK